MTKLMSIGGLPVVDATKPLKITITSRDITDGNKKDPAGCAAARAIKRCDEECTKAFVHLGRTYVRHEKKYIRYQTPQRLRTEIVSFDRGGDFAPGEYTLRTLSPSARSGERHQGGHVEKPGRKHIKKKPHIAKRRYLTGVRHMGGAR